MARAGLDESVILETAAEIANTEGFENLSLKSLSQKLGIKSPSLYKYIKNIDDLKEKLMLFGYKALDAKTVYDAMGKTGFDAIVSICDSYYDFALSNPGVFSAMLWYNKYDDKEHLMASFKIFELVFRSMRSLNYTDEEINHLIRTLRSFLQGYCMLVVKNSFGHPVSVKDSFDISVEVLINGIKAMKEKASTK